MASAEQVACLLYWFLGHAVWLPGDYAVAIVSVVRTGMARSSLECWLFILSAVACGQRWASGRRQECEPTQAAARRLWGKVASTTGV